MKTLGIVGGIGPESTIEYYRQIVALYRERTGNVDYPAIVINSINMTYMLDLIGSGRLPEAVEYLSGEVTKLAAAGADVGLFASNTPHLVFPDLAARSPIPLISIVEATLRQTEKVGLDRVGLFGTRFTMQGATYDRVFAGSAIKLIKPKPDEQEYIHNKYMSEFLYNHIRPEAKAGLLRIVDRMRREDGMSGLILGGTELPLILRDGDDPSVPFLDTTRIHVESAVAAIM